VRSRAEQLVTAAGEIGAALADAMVTVAAQLVEHTAQAKELVQAEAAQARTSLTELLDQLAAERAEWAEASAKAVRANDRAAGRVVERISEAAARAVEGVASAGEQVVQVIADQREQAEEQAQLFADEVLALHERWEKRDATRETRSQGKLDAAIPRLEATLAKQVDALSAQVQRLLDRDAEQDRRRTAQLTEVLEDVLGRAGVGRRSRSRVSGLLDPSRRATTDNEEQL
jgi:hypothetical protein